MARRLSQGLPYAERQFSAFQDSCDTMAENEHVRDQPDGWTFKVAERSAGVYEGVATHVNDASIRAVDCDPDQVLKRLRNEASALVTRQSHRPKRHER